MRLNQDFFAGARAALPILLGVVPFAMISGAAAVSVGLSAFEAVGMSFIVFAGASLAHIWTALHFGDYLAYYLAVAYQTDPTPVEALAHLKEMLANAKDSNVS